jgi:hypothetical protein
MPPSAAEGMTGARGSIARPAESPPPRMASRGGGRAFGSGPRRTLRLALAITTVIVLAVLAGVLLSGGDGPTGTAPLRYGGLPSWLPKSSAPVNRELHASRAHPTLAIQGNTVAVQLAAGRVLATAVGPRVPEDGRFPVPPTSPCTFIVTFASASGVVPLSAADFTFVDELGHVRHPRVSTLDGGSIPARVAPGRPLSLKVYDVLPTGDGGLSWAPEGRRPLASWDFDVEID